MNSDWKIILPVVVLGLSVYRTANAQGVENSIPNIYRYGINTEEQYSGVIRSSSFSERLPILNGNLAKRGGSMSFSPGSLGGKVRKGLRDTDIDGLHEPSDKDKIDEEYHRLMEMTGGIKERVGLDLGKFIREGHARHLGYDVSGTGYWLPVNISEVLEEVCNKEDFKECSEWQEFFENLKREATKAGNRENSFRNVYNSELGNGLSGAGLVPNTARKHTVSSGRFDRRVTENTPIGEIETSTVGLERPPLGTIESFSTGVRAFGDALGPARQETVERFYTSGRTTGDAIGSLESFMHEIPLYNDYTEIGNGGYVVEEIDRVFKDSIGTTSSRKIGTVNNAADISSGPAAEVMHGIYNTNVRAVPVRVVGNIDSVGHRNIAHIDNGYHGIYKDNDGTVTGRRVLNVDEVKNRNIGTSVGEMYRSSPVIKVGNINNEETHRDIVYETQGMHSVYNVNTETVPGRATDNINVLRNINNIPNPHVEAFTDAPLEKVSDVPKRNIRYTTEEIHRVYEGNVKTDTRGGVDYANDEISRNIGATPEIIYDVYTDKVSVTPARALGHEKDAVHKNIVINPEQNHGFHKDNVGTSVGRVIGHDHHVEHINSGHRTERKDIFHKDNVRIGPGRVVGHGHGINDGHNFDKADSTQYDHQLRHGYNSGHGGNYHSHVDYRKITDSSKDNVNGFNESRKKNLVPSFEEKPILTYKKLPYSEDPSSAPNRIFKQGGLSKMSSVIV